MSRATPVRSYSSSIGRVVYTLKCEFLGVAASPSPADLYPISRSDASLKKRIIRTLIQDVVADVESNAGEVILFIHWKGGLHTEVRVPRRRRVPFSRGPLPDQS